MCLSINQMINATYFHPSRRRASVAGWVLLTLALIAIGATLSWWWRGTGETGVNPGLQTSEAERGPVVQTILTTGELNPVRTVQVGSQISGIIQELLADFNSPVREGQVIARLEPAMYEADVALARAELERTQAAYDLARLHKDRVIQLHARELVSDSERDEARVRLRQAAADLQIRTHSLEKAQLQLDRCTIVSPVDGVVISRNVDVGQTVAASLSAPVLFEIAEDLTRMQIHSNVSEADVGRVEEGQRVEFRVDAHRETTFEGFVRQVRNAPQIVDSVVTYDAIVYVDNPELKLKPGMTAEVQFITAERDDVLRVRNAALRARLPEDLIPAAPVADHRLDGDDVRTVYRLRGGSLEAVHVRTGISDGVHSEVIEGLEAGDVLVTGLALRREDDSGSGPSLLRGRQAQY